MSLSVLQTAQILFSQQRKSQSLTHESNPRDTDDLKVFLFFFFAFHSIHLHYYDYYYYYFYYHYFILFLLATSRAVTYSLDVVPKGTCFGSPVPVEYRKAVDFMGWNLVGGDYAMSPFKTGNC